MTVRVQKGQIWKYKNQKWTVVRLETTGVIPQGVAVLHRFYRQMPELVERGYLLRLEVGVLEGGQGDWELLVDLARVGDIWTWIRFSDAKRFYYTVIAVDSMEIDLIESQVVTLRPDDNGAIAKLMLDQLVPSDGWKRVGTDHQVARTFEASRPRLVVVESPYAGDVERNLRYLRACMADCFKRGEAPFASHGLYTQPGVLDDNDPRERELGIEAGLAWGRRADATIVYTDLGISRGMEQGIARARAENRVIEYRELGESWLKQEEERKFGKAIAQVMLAEKAVGLRDKAWSDALGKHAPARPGPRRPNEVDEWLRSWAETTFKVAKVTLRHRGGLWKTAAKKYRARAQDFEERLQTLSKAVKEFVERRQAEEATRARDTFDQLDMVRKLMRELRG